MLVACSEMYFQGVSTRNVRQVLEAMCDGEISSATVSRVAADKVVVAAASQAVAAEWVVAVVASPAAAVLRA